MASIRKQPVKRNLKQQRAARTRVEILSAAIREFGRRSYLETSVIQLARAIGMTPGALYWHFPTKEDLLLAAIEELHRRFLESFSGVLEEARRRSARSQVEGFFRHTARFFSKNPEYGRFYGMLLALSTQTHRRIAAAVRDALAVYVEAFARIVRDGQKAGEFRLDVNPQRLAHAIVAAFSGLMLHAEVFGDEVSSLMMGRVLQSLTGRGLERPAASAAPIRRIAGARA